MSDFYVGKILGIPLRIHWSWFLAVFLIAWTLATNYFPATLPEYAGESAWYWTLGILSAGGLFLSLILHELGHAVVALRCRVPVRGIRLFVFGGVAELGAEPRKAWHEILIALAGPLVTLILIGFYVLGAELIMPLTGVAWTGTAESAHLQGGSSLGVGLTALFIYLAAINGMVLVFNMIPAFPLDGGRVFRGVVWAISGNYLRSTRIAGALGIGFAWLLFVGGIVNLVGNGSVVQGMWMFFLGMFLQNAAQGSIAYAQLRHLLQGVKVKELMRSQPLTVSADLSLQDVVDQFFLRLPHKAYPVVQNGKFLGVLTLRSLQEVERGKWPHVRAGELFLEAKPRAQLRPEEPVLHALRKFAETASSRLPVVDGADLVGLLCRRDVMDYLENQAGLRDK